MSTEKKAPGRASWLRCWGPISRQTIPGTIRRLYNSNRLVALKTLIAKNRGGLIARRKMQKLIMSASGEDGQSMDINTGISWESCEGMKEVMEGRQGAVGG